MKKKIIEHYIKWNLVYGFIGMVISFVSVINSETLRAEFMTMTHHNHGAALFLIITYFLIIVLPSFAAFAYSVYTVIMCICMNKEKGFKDKMLFNDETKCNK